MGKQIKGNYLNNSLKPQFIYPLFSILYYPIDINLFKNIPVLIQNIPQKPPSKLVLTASALVQRLSDPVPTFSWVVPKLSALVQRLSDLVPTFSWVVPKLSDPVPKFSALVQRLSVDGNPCYIYIPLLIGNNPD